MFAVTRIAIIEYRGRDVKLIRLRNPWGNDVEWKGAWSDNSREWNAIDQDTKKQIEFKKEFEGEFWMSFDDFCDNFHTLQICGLTPDAFSEELLATYKNKNIGWQMVAYHGSWVKGVSAGGCGQYDASAFWTNPQFLVTLTDVDSDDNENLATMIVALMQKHTREKRFKTNGDPAEEYIQFRVYKIKSQHDADMAKRSGAKLYASQLDKVGSSDSYINRREVTKRFRIAPGSYLIIPSCYDQGAEGEFLLRVFTEKLIANNNAQFLVEDKKNLQDSDVFFQTDVDIDSEFGNWANLLGGDGDTASNSSSILNPRPAQPMSNVQPKPSVSPRPGTYVSTFSFKPKPAPSYGFNFDSNSGFPNSFDFTNFGNNLPRFGSDIGFDLNNNARGGSASRTVTVQVRSALENSPFAKKSVREELDKQKSRFSNAKKSIKENCNQM